MPRISLSGVYKRAAVLGLDVGGEPVVFTNRGNNGLALLRYEVVGGPEARD